MSAHVEWLEARGLFVEVLPGGSEVGDNSVDQDKWAVVLSGDDAVVIEGTLSELEHLTQRIRTVINRAGS